MIKYFLTGIVFTTIIVAGRYFIQTTSSDMPNQSEHKTLDTPVVSDTIAQGEVAQPEYASNTSATRGGNLQDTTYRQQGFDSLGENALWSESENQTAVPERFLSKGLNPQALSISHSTIQNLKIGDEISLSIPQLAQAYPMDIDQVRKHSNGDRTVSGHLKDTDLPYNVIITSGKQASFATINTPDGSYVMEAAGDIGWIMSIANLDYLIDTNLEDFQLPDINR